MDDTTIGQYRVTGLIGRGGMGAVYAAEHALLGRPAAIKVLLPDLSQKQDVVMRFFNEARAATAIRHPGIIEIYDFGWTPEGAAFIVMEHLEGETLGRRASRVPFRWPGVLAIARQIAGALAAAHAKGIVHRDLKPDNVFLVPDPEVPGGERIKLLDFGIAKLAVDSSPSSNVTKTGAVMGTPTYMAPEQCRGVTVDHRADLYALGCVIYELCCGRPPFVGEGSGDVLAAHIHLPVPPMAANDREIPPAVEQLVQHLLAKAPADRVQSAEELIRAIDAVTTEGATVATGPRRVVPIARAPSMTTLSGSATTSMLLPRSRRRWPIAAFSVGVAAITVVIVALVMRGDDAPAVASHPAEPAVPSATPAAPAQPPAGSPQPAGAPAPPPAAPVPVPGASRDEPSPPAPPPASEDRTASPAPAEPPAPEPSHGDLVPRPRDPADTIAVAIDSAPSGAQVVLDGTVLGTTPYRTTLTRRDREIKLVLRLAGYSDKVVFARESRPITERVALVRKAAPTPAKGSKTDRDRSVNPF
jgi:eukaryotic-like serine/threonine-protein kinase